MNITTLELIVIAEGIAILYFWIVKITTHTDHEARIRNLEIWRGTHIDNHLSHEVKRI